MSKTIKEVLLEFHSGKTSLEEAIKAVRSAVIEEDELPWNLDGN